MPAAHSNPETRSVIPLDRELGSSQRTMLARLRECGSWHRGSKKSWDIPSRTLKLLDSLVHRGFVTKELMSNQTEYIYKPVVRKGNDLGLGQV